MASRSFLEEELLCPLCHDIFINPVVLSCSHNVCEYCIRRFWENEACKVCPVCQRRSSSDHPPVNLALRKQCETYQQERRQTSLSGVETICRVHNEKLRLFCLDDQQLVCVVCRDSRKHSNHRFCPVDEAAMDNKEKLKDALKPLQEELRMLKNFKQNLDHTAQDIKIQSQDAEQKIKEEFKKLHQLLHDEETARITALRKEEKQRSLITMETTDNINKQISFLSQTIKDTEEQMKNEDLYFLQNFKSILQRAQCSLTDPQSVSAEIISFSNHLRNLKLDVLQKMQENVSKASITPLQLTDPVSFGFGATPDDSAKCNENRIHKPKRKGERPRRPFGLIPGLDPVDVELVKSTPITKIKP